MGWGILADALLLLHGAFIVWATFGALAVWRWPRLAWLHLPALAWGLWIEASAGICPLTPLETMLRQRAGQQGYATSFIDHHLADAGRAGTHRAGAGGLQPAALRADRAASLAGAAHALISGAISTYQESA
jgi:Protein of Unknown function (DUF2784)